MFQDQPTMEQKNAFFTGQPNFSIWDFKLTLIGLAALAAAAFFAKEDPFLLMLASFTCGSFIFAEFVLRDRKVSSEEAAVEQCLAVAERYGVALTPWQVRRLEQIRSEHWREKEDVFIAFITHLRKVRPELVPDAFFVGSGGKRKSAYPEVMRYLWTREIVGSEVAQNGEAGTLPSPAIS